MTHLPFRSWCRHCIKGREREEDQREKSEKSIWTSCSWTTKRKGEARERATRALLSTVVPRKSTGMDMSKADGDVFVKLVWTLWTSS